MLVLEEHDCGVCLDTLILIWRVPATPRLKWAWCECAKRKVA